MVIPANPEAPKLAPNLFRQCLLDNLRDGVIFVDARCRILVWSQSVEVMTGISSSRVDGVELTPALLGLNDCQGNPVLENPLIECFEEKRKTSKDFKLIGRSGREVKVEMSFSPVMGSDRSIQGAVILVHDSSVQLDLKRQLQDLYEFSMLDPLTQVANRAEFERVLDEFVRLRNTSDFQCSLIVCDIDFFKQVNDNYNHHIGDQALVSFAGLLKKFVRARDVVARYGGEEFVILCANCDRASAVQRAEEIRLTLTKTPQQMLDGKCITASFGVSELLAGDTATNFFIRADTALLRAKELGRNRVVEADAASQNGETEMKSAEITSLAGVTWRKAKGQSLLCEEYGTTTPLAVLVEKLRGYILDTEAEIRRVSPDFASLIVEAEDPDNFSRKGTFVVDIEFKERETEGEEQTFGRRKKSFIRITVREGKRKWFSTNARELAPVVVSELRRYLMINDEASKLKVTPVATKPGEGR
jgi:diguanylate cyclase (GGDEF)-like protein/PAS domain S-box-containing protein